MSLAFLREAKLRRQKNGLKKKKKEKAGVSTKELQEITDNAVPVTTKNKNVEILCIHEDYEKNPKCLSQSVLLNSLLVVVVLNFRNR